MKMSAFELKSIIGIATQNVRIVMKKRCGFESQVTMNKNLNQSKISKLNQK